MTAHTTFQMLVATQLASASGTARPAGHREYPRRNAKVTPEQVLAVLDLQERRGGGAARIATKLKMPEHQVRGVLNGNGTRTVALKR